MDISPAAQPPIQPPVSDKDREHPRWRQYEAHRNFCIQKMITANSFEGWLYQHEAEKRSTAWSKHERYPEFLAWMRETQAGGRKCLPSKDWPDGIYFPDNFIHWLEGGRW